MSLTQNAQLFPKLENIKKRKKGKEQKLGEPQKAHPYPFLSVVRSCISIYNNS